MKKVISVMVAILVVASLAVSAVATVPSPSSADVVEISVVSGAVCDAEGNVVVENAAESVFVASFTTYAEQPDADPNIVAEMEAAYENLKAAGSIDVVCPEFAGKELFDLTYVGADEEVAEIINNGGSVTLTLSMNVEADAQLNAMFFEEDTWTACPEDTLTVLEDGDVGFNAAKLGIYAILVG